jgi:hypothetical protein
MINIRANRRGVGQSARYFCREPGVERGRGKVSIGLAKSEFASKRTLGGPRFHNSAAAVVPCLFVPLSLYMGNA